jgi:hypothetical protein
MSSTSTAAHEQPSAGPYHSKVEGAIMVAHNRLRSMASLIIACYRLLSLFVCRPRHLWLLLSYYKLYPVSRAAWMVFEQQNPRFFMHRLHKWEKHLASVINELGEAWSNRFQPQNALPHVFDSKVTGSIDSFPIEINRPPNNVQRLFYNGKYAKHVVKVSA